MSGGDHVAGGPLPDRADAVVVGAGLAGLAAATTLHRAGRSVVVLEAADGVGGRVRTDLIDGFLCDRGFQILLTGYPELARQLDVAALDLQRFDPGALVRIGGEGYVVGDPLRQPSALLSTLRSPVGTVGDKLRLLRERRRWKSITVPDLLRQPPMATGDALRSRGFTPAIIDRFFRPLAGGFQLDPALAGPVGMFDTIMAMLTRGDAAVPAAGMGAIPQQMAQRLPGGMVRFNRAVVGVERSGVRLTTGERIMADSVVVAAEGPAASALLGLAPVGSKPVGCVYFAATRAPTRHKLIVLDGEGSGPALNVAVLSNVAPSYAPAGQHLVVAAIPTVTDGDLAAAVRSQLRGWWGAQVDDWRELATYRIPHAQPFTAPSFRPKQPVSLGEGRFVCGDHRDTPSIQGALYSGRRCGEAAAAHLSALTRTGP